MYLLLLLLFFLLLLFLCYVVFLLLINLLIHSFLGRYAPLLVEVFVIVKL